MRVLRYPLWFLAINVGLAACSPRPTATPFQTQIGLETLVAQSHQTEQAGYTATPQLPTSTPQPPTATETLPPTATFTPSPTLTPVRPASDPRLKFGPPDWQDNFDSGDNWTTFDGEKTAVEIENGQYAYTSHAPDGKSYWLLSWPKARNFFLEVNTISPDECSGKDRWGVFFRAPDEGQGYLLNISCDGQYRLVKVSSQGFEILAPWKANAAILAGPNQLNRLGIWAQGKVIAIYVNGVPLAGLEDTSYNQAGRFGFSIASENTENFTVIFDDFSFWSIQ